MSEAFLHHHVGFGEGLLHVADDFLDPPDDVALSGMDLGGLLAHGRFGVDHGRPWLVFDRDRLGRIGGPVAIGGQDRGDGLADVADLAAREDGLGPG